MLQQITRRLFQQERLPPLLLWTLVADGMRLWYKVLRIGLSPHLGGDANTTRVLAKASASIFARRFGVLQQKNRALTDETSIGAVMGALYMSPIMRESDWILSSVGGVATGLREQLKAQRALASMTPTPTRSWGTSASTAASSMASG